jgi:hypothetical protein
LDQGISIYILVKTGTSRSMDSTDGPDMKARGSDIITTITRNEVVQVLIPTLGECSAN